MTLFSVPIFFILLRETTEAAIIVSVLLSFCRQVFGEDPAVLKRLNKQIWLGTLIGLIISMVIGAVFIVIWYTVASNLWNTSENLWEACFGLLSTVLITIMAIAMLKTNNSQEKWRAKLIHAMSEEQRNKKGVKGKYSLLFLPLITVLREGLEAMVFMGGVALGEDGKSIPLAAATGIALGCLIGYIMYR
ncbi:iron permease FTR1/Fip1/EfeU, partial [Blyttiomyces helicus]